MPQNLLYAFLLPLTAYSLWEYQYQQLFILLYFPVALLVNRQIKGVSKKYLTGKWIPDIGVAVLALATVGILWEPYDTYALFEEGGGASWVIAGSMLAAGYAGIYFLRSWQWLTAMRWSLCLTYITLWWPFFQAYFEYRYATLGWMLVLPAAIPLFVSYEKLFPVRLFMDRKYSQAYPKNLLIEVLKDESLLSVVPERAIAKISSDEELHHLFWDDSLQDDLKEAAVRRIKDPKFLTHIILYGGWNISCRNLAVKQLSAEEAKLIHLFDKVDTLAIKQTLLKQIKDTAFLTRVLQDSRMENALRLQAAQQLNDESIIYEVFKAALAEEPELASKLLEYLPIEKYQRDVMQMPNPPQPLLFATLKQVKDKNLFLSGYHKLTQPADRL